MLGWAAMMHIECIQYTVAMSLSKLIIKKIFKKRSMPLPPKWSKNKRNQAFIKIGQNTLKPKKRKIKKTVATKQHYSVNVLGKLVDWKQNSTKCWHSIMLCAWSHCKSTMSDKFEKRFAQKFPNEMALKFVD